MTKLTTYALKIWQWIKMNFWSGVVLFIVITFGWVLLLRFVPVPITYLMIKRSVTDHGSLQYEWLPWQRMAPSIKVCAMASEDQNLPFHYGIDFNMIDKAMEVNKSSRKVFGASTITQQVAKNVFLFPERSYVRKALEVYFSLLIETIWPKERILEVYLNIAEMGTLVFGVEAASQKYYKKPASRLNLRESAAIIASLPNPRKYNVLNPGPYLSRRTNEIVSLYGQLDGTNYLRELYVHSEKSLYNFRKYKK